MVGIIEGINEGSLVCPVNVGFIEGIFVGCKDGS